MTCRNWLHASEGSGAWRNLSLLTFPADWQSSDVADSSSPVARGTRYGCCSGTDGASRIG